MHYPLFKHVGRDKFASYEAYHTHRITLLVAPLMITEAVLTTSACLQSVQLLGHLHISEQHFYDRAALLRMLLLLLIWVRPMFVKPALHLPTSGIAYSTAAHTLQSWNDAHVCMNVQGSTALLQVPCHSILAKGFDATAHERLVNTNWIRTICWWASVL